MCSGAQTTFYFQLTTDNWRGTCWLLSRATFRRRTLPYHDAITIALKGGDGIHRDLLVYCSGVSSLFLLPPNTTEEQDKHDYHPSHAHSLGSTSSHRSPVHTRWSATYICLPPTNYWKSVPNPLPPPEGTSKPVEVYWYHPSAREGTRKRTICLRVRTLTQVIVITVDHVSFKVPFRSPQSVQALHATQESVADNMTIKVDCTRPRSVFNSPSGRALASPCPNNVLNLVLPAAAAT